mmetsp:Transcript_47233/g.102959  ORF Transcript_47233/g.102959 Transcript_47233/m.102959 type:complete len:232 (+) Transcript_47233:467-1162(+)
MNFNRRIEHIGHYNKIEILLLQWPETRDSLLNSEAMEAQKPNHQCLGIVFDVVVVPFQNLPQKYKLLGRDRLHHVLSISCVVKECTALSFGGELGQRGEVSKNHVPKHLLRSYRTQIFLLVDAELSSDLLKDHGRKVHETSRFPLVSVGHQTWSDGELFLHDEIHRLKLTMHLMFAACNGHSNSNHHAENHIPALMTEVHRQALFRSRQAKQPDRLVAFPVAGLHGLLLAP